MLEQRRVDYLRAMGITAWMPRKALPHAPASRWIAEDTPSERHEHISIEVEHDHARPAAAADLLRAGQPVANHSQAASVSRPEVNKTTAPQVPAQTEEVASDRPHSQDVISDPAISEPVVSASGEPPRFALEFLQLSGDTVWVFDASQPLDRAIPFITRVVKAFDPTVTIVPQPVSFRWPFIESRHQDQSEAVALQALKAQWQHFSSQGVRGVITVGPAAQTWMAKGGVSSGFHINDVDALMHSAENKRALWLALIPLVQSSDSN